MPQLVPLEEANRWRRENDLPELEVDEESEEE